MLSRTDICKITTNYSQRITAASGLLYPFHPTIRHRPSARTHRTLSTPPLPTCHHQRNGGR